MTMPAYRVLIVDDSEGEFGFGQSAKLEMSGDANFEVDLVHSAKDARKAVTTKIYDVFVLDVYLHKPQEGIDLAGWLRVQGFLQPIVLTTDNPDERGVAIGRYEAVLRDGPTFFYFKSDPKTSTAEMIRAAAERSDILLRSLRVLSEGKIPMSSLRIDDQVFTVHDLLGMYKKESDAPGQIPALRAARKALREGLGALLVTYLEDSPHGNSR